MKVTFTEADIFFSGEEVYKEPEYNKYIHSSKWKRFKKKLIQNRGRKCEYCGDGRRSTVITAHHLTYARFGREHLKDVKLACLECHYKEEMKKLGLIKKVKDKLNTEKDKQT